MKTFSTFSRLVCLSAVLAAGVALTTGVAIAGAKDSHHNNAPDKNGASPHFVVSGQPVNVKRVRNSHEDDYRNRKDRKHAEKTKKHCGKTIVPTEGCPVSTQDPVGSVPPPSSNSGAKGPSPSFTSATISNGVLSSTIFNGKGLTITSNSPGTLTVSNGTSSVTLPGGSLTLHGASSVSVPAGYQLVTHANGDVTVAVSPVLARGPAGSRSDPPGVSLTDNLKTAGGASSTLATIPAIDVIGVAMVGPAAAMGAIKGDVGGSINDLGNFLTDAYSRALSWF